MIKILAGKTKEKNYGQIMLQNLEQDDPKKRRKYVSVVDSEPVMHDSQTPK